MNERQKINLIFECVNLATWRIDADGNVFWDDRMFDLYKMKPGDGLQIMDFRSKVYESDWPKFNEVLKNGIENRINFDLNVRILVDGIYCWFKIVGKICDDGSICGITQNVDFVVRQILDQQQKIKIVETLYLKK